MPRLTGYPPLDVAIGLSFVYLLFSVLCSAVQEAIAGVLEWRAKMLEQGLRELLEDKGNKGEAGAPAAVASVAKEGLAAPDPPEGSVAAKQSPREGPSLTAQVLGHGLIRPTYRAKNKPSYIDPKLFALALLDIVAPAAEHDPIEAVQKQIALATVPATVKDALLGLTKTIADDRDELRKGIEDWFNATMERVSGWYKRKAQIVICVLSLVATVALNINTLAIGETLAKDGAVRAGVVAQAEKSTLKTNATPKEAAKAIGEVEQLGVPIGWDKAKGEPAHVSLFVTWRDTIRTLGGWLLTFIALSLGAPFWFGLLNKLTNLRTSGQAPATGTESKG